MYDAARVLRGGQYGEHTQRHRFIYRRTREEYHAVSVLCGSCGGFNCRRSGSDISLFCLCRPCPRNARIWKGRQPSLGLDTKFSDSSDRYGNGPCRRNLLRQEIAHDTSPFKKTLWQASVAQRQDVVEFKGRASASAFLRVMVFGNLGLGPG